MSKIIIYQLLPRLFTNYKIQTNFNGSIEESGCGKFNTITDKALHQISKMGFTHVWYTGVIEHATQTDYSDYGMPADHPHVVKGKAGSPYAIRDYYDVDPDLAEHVADRMSEFEALVERTHQHNLKLVIDFVPNHVARKYYSDSKPSGVVDLGENDKVDFPFFKDNNFYYLPGQSFFAPTENSDFIEYPAKVTGNDRFSAYPEINDWYDTVKLNYGYDYLSAIKYFDPIPDTWFKMRDILLFWAAKGVDGFRCDMAEMVPVEFWEWAIHEVKTLYPAIVFIAEVYDPHQYHAYIFKGGFDYLYDKVGMYDTLRNIICYSHDASSISKAWQEQNSVLDKMLYFLENHDEQRIASEFFAGDPRKSFPAMIVAAALTKGPLMIYAGQELGEQAMDAEGFSGRDGRTSIFDYSAIKSIQQWANGGEFDGEMLSVSQIAFRNFYLRLLSILNNEKAIAKGKMYDLQYANFENELYDASSKFAWIRQFEDELILVAVNFEPSAANIGIKLPKDLFDWLGIEENQIYCMLDLLDESFKQNININSFDKINLDLPAYSGRILKMSVVST